MIVKIEDLDFAQSVHEHTEVTHEWIQDAEEVDFAAGEARRSEFEGSSGWPLQPGATLELDWIVRGTQDAPGKDWRMEIEEHNSHGPALRLLDDDGNQIKAQDRDGYELDPFELADVLIELFAIPVEWEGQALEAVYESASGTELMPKAAERG